MTVVHSFFEDCLIHKFLHNFHYLNAQNDNDLKPSHVAAGHVGMWFAVGWVMSPKFMSTLETQNVTSFAGRILAYVIS